MTTVAALMKARGSVSNHPGRRERIPGAWESDPASGADLTGPCLHGQSQDGLSGGCPAYAVVPGAGSRTAPAHKKAARCANTRGRDQEGTPDGAAR